MLYLGAFGDKRQADLEREFQELGVWDTRAAKEGDFQKELGNFLGAYSRGHYRDRIFEEIYEILEDLRTFAK